MPAKRFAEDVVLDALNRLFRARGYDGASLVEIMAATGLAKASLYHRFANGKVEMATAVLERTASVFASHILQPLTVEGDPSTRLAETARRLRRFYEDGRLSCLLETLTVRRLESSRDPHPVQMVAAATLAFWIRTFAAFAEATGFGAEEARSRAEQAVAGIEGGLVLARISGSPRSFLAAVDELPDRLIGPAQPSGGFQGE